MQLRTCNRYVTYVHMYIPYSAGKEKHFFFTFLRDRRPNLFAWEENEFRVSILDFAAKNAFSRLIFVHLQTTKLIFAEKC